MHARCPRRPPRTRREAPAGPAGHGNATVGRRHVGPLALAALLVAASPATGHPAGSALTGSSVGAAGSPGAFPVREVRYDLDLRVDLAEEKLFAEVLLTVENHTETPAREVPLKLHRLLTVRSVQGEEGADLPFRQEVTASERSPRKQVNYVRIPLPDPLGPGDRATLRIVYDGYLSGYTETGMLYVRDHVDDEFTILRQDAHAYPEVGRPGAGWPGLPSFDYTARITVPATHAVANGGELVGRETAGDRVAYRYRNVKPAWRMDFAVARYGSLERDGGRFRVHYLPGDSAGAARVLEAVTRSMDLYRGWFGPLRESPRLTVIEIPDGYGSQKDVTSILQTAAAFRDPDRVYEVYHEVSHFWNVPSTDSPSPRLEEGLASYLEDLAVEELDGRRRLEPAIERLEEWVRRAFAGSSLYRETPMEAYGREDITGLSYGVGELMFYALAEVVGGETLHRILGRYYQRYADSGAGVKELAALADEMSEVDLSAFFRDWLFTTRWYDHVAAGGTVAGYAAEYVTARRAAR